MRKLLMLLLIVIVLVVVVPFVMDVVRYPGRVCASLAHGQPSYAMGDTCFVDNGYGKSWETHNMNPWLP